MTCPKCHAEFDSPGSVCPACGVRLLRNVSGVVRTSAVMISTGDESGFYHSVKDVPEPLRSRLVESTAGDNSGTIVIADRAGKEQLTEVLARRENRPARSLAADRVEAAGTPARRFTLPRISWLAWAGFILVLLFAALFSVYFGLRW